MNPTLQLPNVNQKLDWSPYITENDSQSQYGFDTDACVSFSAVENLELILNYKLSVGTISAMALSWCKANGYINQSGKFELSERYTAVTSGTAVGSNTPGNVGNAICNYGLIPLNLWPLNYSLTETWQEWYQEPPASVITLGKEFLQFFKIEYQLLYTNITALSPVLVSALLAQSPLQITIHAGAHEVNFISYDKSKDLYGFYDQYIPFEYSEPSTFLINAVTRYNITMQPTYSTSFLAAIANTLGPDPRIGAGWEGGLVNNPKDKGGITNFGISQATYPDLDIANMTKSEAVQIYYEDFWTPIEGDKMPQELAINVFDAAVNMGVEKAIELMQTALEVIPDGDIGAKTLSAMAKSSSLNVQQFVVLRTMAYTNDVQFATFGTAWVTRTIGTLLISVSSK